jgi:putative kinase
MDGYHHSNDYLNSHVVDGSTVPLKSIKGKPETFDTQTLLRHLQALSGQSPVYAQYYDRTIHDPVANSVLIDLQRY